MTPRFFFAVGNLQHLLIFQSHYFHYLYLYLVVTLYTVLCFVIWKPCDHIKHNLAKQTIMAPILCHEFSLRIILLSYHEKIYLTLHFTYISHLLHYIIIFSLRIMKKYILPYILPISPIYNFT